MELRHLEYFLMISKELHFTKAAEKLGVSQPTLSHQIKALEHELGYTLFNRIGKKIELTEVGKIVQKEALHIQDSLRNISSQIKAFEEIESGELKITVLPGEITDLVATLCVKFNELYPKVKVLIQSTDRIEATMLENKADFGIGFNFTDHHTLQMTKLYVEQFYLISNQQKNENMISFSSALDTPLILFPETHQCRKILIKSSNQLGKALVPIIETSSIESILRLVQSGVGSSVVSRTLYEFYNTEDLFYQHIDHPQLTTNVYLVTKKNCFINFAAREFIKLLVKEIELLRFNTDKESLASLRNSLS